MPEEEYNTAGEGTSVIDVNAESEDSASYVFFNKKYRRFRVGRFEFKKNYLRLNAADRDEFLDLLNAKNFPKREALNIVEINESARAATETSVLKDTNPNGGVTSKIAGNGPGVIRGPMAASDIMTAKDQQRLADMQSKPQQGGGGLNPTPAGPQPTFKIPTNFGNK